MLTSAQQTPRVLTVIFTDVCPLQCSYCDMEYSDGGESRVLTKEMFVGNIRNFIKKNKVCGHPLRIIFSGGEPFVRWDWIKEIILQYGQDIQYGFNTSGYLLTNEIIRFLSKYEVYWTLSVDGDEQISKWRRPSKNGRYDYWDKFLGMLPSLLYYFPNLTWKSVISRRVIPYIHRIWRSAEQLGFHSVLFIPDFLETPKFYEGKKQIVRAQNEWKEKDYDVMQEQYDKIAFDFASGVLGGKIRPLDYEMNTILRGLFLSYKYPDRVNCGILEGRGLVIHSSDEDDYCLCINDIGILKGKTKEEQLKFISNLTSPQCCPKDEKCFLWDLYCKRETCLLDNYTVSDDFFSRPDHDCRHTLIAGKAVIKILNMLNNTDSKFYEALLALIEERGGFPWEHIPLA